MPTFNRSVLQAALRSRSLTEEALSQRTGYSFSEFEHEIERGPAQSLVSAISKELSVPSFMFYMKEAPSFENNVLDFRHPEPQATAKSRTTIETIQIAYS